MTIQKCKILTFLNLKSKIPNEVYLSASIVSSLLGNSLLSLIKYCHVKGSWVSLQFDLTFRSYFSFQIIFLSGSGLPSAKHYDIVWLPINILSYFHHNSLKMSFLALNKELTPDLNKSLRLKLVWHLKRPDGYLGIAVL